MVTFNPFATTANNARRRPRIAFRLAIRALRAEALRSARRGKRKAHGRQNLGMSGKGSLPPETCMRPSSAQRCSTGNTFPGLSSASGSKAHFSRC